jgi:hypothetical protein
MKFPQIGIPKLKPTVSRRVNKVKPMRKYIDIGFFPNARRKRIIPSRVKKHLDEM